MLLAHIKKELLLLSRDRAGLLVLFVMPMLLVLVLSLIQDNLFRASGKSAIQALYVNLDAGSLGSSFAEQLKGNGTIQLVEESAGKQLTVEMARHKVLEGSYQFAIIVPEGFSAGIDAAAIAAVRSAFGGKTDTPEPIGMKILFDPAVRGVYRTAVTNSLYRALLGLEIARKSELFVRQLPKELEKNLETRLGSEFAGTVQLPEISSDWARQPLVELNEESASPEKFKTLPTSVQQNVPAWTLFGMFFIVIPLAGTLVRERQDGTLMRLMAMPVGNGSLLLGKIFAFQCICLVQFGLMLAVGKFILPLLGTPVLDLGNAPLALLVVALSAALAACGYGLLVGVLARSYEQASSFGSVSVVIAAALGGIMVPVYVMPPAMQKLSVVSPLGWGLDAFLDIFVRGGSLGSVLPGIAALCGFFLLCVFIAVLVFRRWRQGE